MNKHGFTLIEIIIVIALISIIGVGSVVGVKTIQKNKDELKEITNRIIESASVYIENEKDTNGNYYINGINEGGQGLILPLEVLHDKGYVNDKDYKYVIKKVSNKKRYVVVGYKTEDECETGASINVNWNEKDVVTTPLYLCSYTKKDTYPKDNTMLNILLRDNKLNLGIPDLNNYKDEDKGLYILPDDDGSSFYFYGKTENNYIKFNDMMWRIIRINGNGSTRIVLDDVIPYPLQKGEIVITKKNYDGSAAQSEVIPLEGEYYDTYEENILCFQTGSSTWKLTCFYDYDDYEKISKTPFTYKLKEDYKVVSNNNLEEDFPDSIYESTKYNILKDFANTLNDKSKIKKDDTYFVNNDYIYRKRDFTFEDDKNNSKLFTDGIQTVSYKELKYSGQSNSYLTDTSKNFYTSDYYSDSYYYYYDISENKILYMKEGFNVTYCTTTYLDCKRSVNLQYPDGTGFAMSDRYYELNVHGFKPVVNLLKDTCYKGKGTKDNPYEIIDCN